MKDKINRLIINIVIISWIMKPLNFTLLLIFMQLKNCLFFFSAHVMLIYMHIIGPMHFAVK